MLTADIAFLTLRAVTAHRLRSGLTMLGIAVGVAAVVLLTSLGEGIHRFVIAEFTQFGTNIIGIYPGKTSTLGISTGAISNVRPLTIEDAEALRRMTEVEAITSVVQGNAAVEHGRRTRRTTVLGVGAQMPQVWRFSPLIGRFLPPDDPRAARAYAVLGATMKKALFGDRNALGELVRIGAERYRIIGVMEHKGQLLGFDLDDTVFIPVGRALAMFDRESVMEIDLVYEAGGRLERVAQHIRDLFIERHGQEDFSITTQDDMLKTLSKILNVLTLGVAALGAISLVVGAVGIVTIMTIAVSERIAEIGLLRALGARKEQILVLFVGEAIILAMIGGVAGLLLGLVGGWLVSALVPALPVQVSWDYALLSLGLAAIIGVLAGVLPAHQAAQLSPVEALRAE
jgi:putative ABC transport system permease protein